MQPSGQIQVHNNTVSSTLNITNITFDIFEINKTIDNIDIPLTQFAQFMADSPNIPITLQNTTLTNVTILIPDKTAIFAPASWNGKLFPPMSVPISGNIPSGFKANDVVYQIGSPSSVLVFDKAVTILFEGVLGKMAYKLANNADWILMDECEGTFANTAEPQEPNECYISNGIDTKILTFHFTEFTTVIEIPKPTPIPTPESTPKSIKTTKSSGGSSGGHGRTGVGPTDYIQPPYTGGTSTTGTSTSGSFPTWFQYSLVKWWTDDMVSDEQFKNAMTYLIDKRILIITDYTNPKVQYGELQPFVKSIFEMWTNDKLPDSTIRKTIQQYRSLGVW